MLQFQEKTLKSMQSIADDMENARADLEISAKMDSCNIALKGLQHLRERYIGS